MPLKGIYQQCIKTLEQLANVRVIINGVIVEVDFQVKNISDLSGGYSIILGRPWLRKVKAVNYCGKGYMVIGLEHDRVQLNVQPTSSEDSTSDIDGGFKTSSTSKWTSVSETSFDYENEIVAEVYELSSEPILENLVTIGLKKNGKWCICVNYKALNDATKKDHFLVSYIDELLDKVAGHERYSSYDGYARYHQVKVRKEDIYKTTFTTPWGTYAYLYMSFGMCNACETFQQLQTKILEPYLGKLVWVYMDDFCVYRSIAEHLQQLCLIFEHLALFG